MWNSKNMRIAFLAVVCLAASIVHAPLLRAQPTCGLSMQITNTPVEHLGLADVDVDHFESRALLFTVQISNNAGVDRQAQLHVALMITLADGTTYPTAVEFTTESFTVPALVGRTVTNLDIGKTKEIKTENFTYDENAKNRIQNIALGTGSFPAGRYLFRFSLIQVTPLCDAGNHDIEIVLHNPSRVELRLPADGVTTNEFPFFQFYQDAGRARLTVAELQPGQSREDAITHKPPMLETELTDQNSLLYSGGRPLEQGKTYVWQVVSEVLASGGADNTIASPIWSFTVSSAAEGTAEDAIILQLKEIFGSRFPAIFDQISRGQFRLTGKFTDNQAPLSQTDLLNLLNELRELSDSAELILE